METRHLSDVSENDALSLEYELLYGCAWRELDITDVVNDADLFDAAVAWTPPTRAMR